MSRLTHIRLMAEYNQWMNAKVYASAMSLPDAVLNADKGAFFGSILGTLNHLVVADTIWLQRFATHPAGFRTLALVRKLPTPTSLNQILETSVQDLAAHRSRLDQWIVDWTHEMRDAVLDQGLRYANLKGVVATRDFFSLLMHFFNHQTHHRGQTTTLLSQAGVDVGVTDLLVLVPNLHDVAPSDAG